MATYKGKVSFHLSLPEMRKRQASAIEREDYREAQYWKDCIETREQQLFEDGMEDQLDELGIKLPKVDA